MATARRSGVRLERPERPERREDFEVAIICALRLEFDAVALAFDELWDSDGDIYGKSQGDRNIYTTGRMGIHDVVLVLLPTMGKASAAGTAAGLRFSYTELKLVILSGICGGVPFPNSSAEILLGDIIIGKKLVQYDFGRQYPDGFVVKDTDEDRLSRPDRHVRSLIATFETEHKAEQLREGVNLCLSQIQQKARDKRRKTQYDFPGRGEDKLFSPEYTHMHRSQTTCGCNEQLSSCEAAVAASCEELECSPSYLVSRKRIEISEEGESAEPMRSSKAASATQEPKIFFGAVGSGDTVIKSGKYRDKIAKNHGLIAFEMEGAGLWDEVPCILVKSVCDYADSHKNKKWQPFAAAAATSAVKAMLKFYTHADHMLDRRFANMSIQDQAGEAPYCRWHST
jgi:nucleoside phosphorylase